jgi:methionyl-tRNA formyltransferase
MNGDKMTGVCVIEMLSKAKGIDAGPIWASQYTVSINSSSGSMDILLNDMDSQSLTMYRMGH